MLETQLTSPYSMMTVRRHLFLLLYSLIFLCLCLPISLTAVTVDLPYTTYSVSEGGGVTNVSLVLTGAAEKEVTVLIHTENQTAIGIL